MSGDAYTKITAVGTTVLSSTPVTLKSIIVSSPIYVGTVDIYNTGLAAGTTAANLVYSVGTFPATAVHAMLPLNISLSKGLTYVASGTPTVIISYE